MNQLKAMIVLAVTVAFAAGAAVGVMASRRSAVRAEESYLDRLCDQYDLGDEQIAAIRRHLDEERQRIDAILSGLEAQVTADIRQARDQAEQKIRAELTQDQQTAFDRDRAGD